jgi:hypothetical protein
MGFELSMTVRRKRSAQLTPYVLAAEQFLPSWRLLLVLAQCKQLSLGGLQLYRLAVFTLPIGEEVVVKALQ